MKLQDRAMRFRNRHFPKAMITPCSLLSNNPVYFIFDEDGRDYCLKIQRPGIPEKERRVTEFYKRNEIARTLEIVLCEEEFLLTELDKDIQEDNYQGTAERLAEMHGKLLNLERKIFPYEEEMFKPTNREAIWREIEQGEITLGLGRKVKDAIELGKSYKPPTGKVPLVLLHGDPHTGNIAKNYNGETKALDFEFARIDVPSTDLANAILTEGPAALPQMTAGYLQRIPELPGYETQENFLGAVYGDLLMRSAHSYVRRAAANQRKETVELAKEKFEGFYETIVSMP